MSYFSHLIILSCIKWPTIPKAVAVTLSFWGNHRADTIGGRAASINPELQCHLYISAYFRNMPKLYCNFHLLDHILNLPKLECDFILLAHFRNLPTRRQRFHRYDKLLWTTFLTTAAAWIQIYMIHNALGLAWNVKVIHLIPDPAAMKKLESRTVARML